MFFQFLKSFLLIVLGFVLYHVVKTNLLQKSKKNIYKNREKTKEFLLEIEKQKVLLSAKEKRKMEKELTNYFASIVVKTGI